MFTALTHLEELHVYKNKISSIPPEIGNLQHIKRISFASNALKGLPDEIGACTTLEELYLSNNPKFSYFPSSAGHLRRLKELSLSRCPALKQLPNTGRNLAPALIHWTALKSPLCAILCFHSAMEMSELKELDLRAAKKQVCKITPELVDALKQHFCKIRGGVVKKGKAKKKAAV